MQCACAILPFMARPSLQYLFHIKRLIRWLFNQHWARWRCLGDNPGQTQEFISGSSLGAKEKILSFNGSSQRKQYPEKASSPHGASGYSDVQEVWNGRGDLGPHSV